MTYFDHTPENQEIVLRMMVAVPECRDAAQPFLAEDSKSTMVRAYRWFWDKPRARSAFKAMDEHWDELSQAVVGAWTEQMGDTDAENVLSAEKQVKLSIERRDDVSSVLTALTLDEVAREVFLKSYPELEQSVDRLVSSGSIVGQKNLRRAVLPRIPYIETKLETDEVRFVERTKEERAVLEQGKSTTRGNEKPFLGGEVVLIDDDDKEFKKAIESRAAVYRWNSVHIEKLKVDGTKKMKLYFC